ncbi:DUF1045 domain-containing protein [Pseudooceanicola algae]|uniref:Phosphonate metabolism protein n=1 Tax=Pseudooceanicola algae TaxID=1537215 RepID=A0A418SKH5_9RHOB|nr:DUF1045 domain-containing protein [Pseudooceanicola algae]QPM89082.1 hypothetical protein PSAL_002920 [Pseudooceanicola algae]
MQDFSRFAIYYLPAPGPLADFGAAWLGWDIATGQPRPHPETGPLPCTVQDITARPRKYGFHGTIKPPFSLADGQTAEALASAARSLCAAQAPVLLQGLALRRIRRFLALTPVGDATDLAMLAGTMVRDLDPFRAPPAPAETARRRKAGLSDRQEALLQQWGYPYVMDEFRFHLTLSGALPDDQARATEAALANLLPALPAPFRIDSLALAGEDAEGRFHLIERLPLNAAG